MLGVADGIDGDPVGAVELYLEPVLDGEVVPQIVGFDLVGEGRLKRRTAEHAVRWLEAGDEPAADGVGAPNLSGRRAKFLLTLLRPGAAWGVVGRSPCLPFCPRSFPLVRSGRWLRFRPVLLLPVASA